MIKDHEACYNFTVANKPGELVKLTKFLADAGMNVSSLRIATLGSKASIRFSAPNPRALQDVFRKVRIA